MVTPEDTNDLIEIKKKLIRGEVKYAPKRNLNADVKYFKLKPFTPTPAQLQPNIIFMALAECDGKQYVAIRDLKTRQEYVEEVHVDKKGELFLSSMDSLRQIFDDTEWAATMEFFKFMGVIQTSATKVRKNTVIYKDEKGKWRRDGYLIDPEDVHKEKKKLIHRL